MADYLLDSDILIWCLRNNEKVVQLVKILAEESIPYCSTLSIVEIQAGARQGEEEETDLFLNSIRVIDLNREIANLAGKYIKEYKRKGITLDFIDSVISATCIVKNLILVTYNVKHYPMKEIKIYNF